LIEQFDQVLVKDARFRGINRESADHFAALAQYKCAARAQICTACNCAPASAAMVIQKIVVDAVHAIAQDCACYGTVQMWTRAIKLKLYPEQVLLVLPMRGDKPADTFFGCRDLQDAGQREFAVLDRDSTHFAKKLRGTR